MPTIQELNELITTLSLQIKAKEKDVSRNEVLLPQLYQIIQNRQLDSTNFATDVPDKSLVIEAFVHNQPSQKIDFFGQSIVDAYYEAMDLFWNKCDALAAQNKTEVIELIAQLQTALTQKMEILNGN